MFTTYFWSPFFELLGKTTATQHQIEAASLPKLCRTQLSIQAVDKHSSTILIFSVKRCEKQDIHHGYGMDIKKPWLHSHASVGLQLPPAREISTEVRAAMCGTITSMEIDPKNLPWENSNGGTMWHPLTAIIHGGTASGANTICGQNHVT